MTAPAFGLVSASPWFVPPFRSFSFSMARLVLKFGGTSVASVERIKNVARHVKREWDAGHDVAVVVSAMSGKTNELVAFCNEASKFHDHAEYDVVVASGEQVVSGLLAVVLKDLGLPARSFQGWQVPIRTTDAHAAARIIDVDGALIRDGFAARREIAVVSGFQGIHAPSGRVTTLGRGGSDTSAVAIAAGIGADRCDIYTDVDGVYTTDPRIVPNARRLDRVSFEEMLEMASLGSKVLQVRSVEIAMVHQVPTYVRSSFDDPENPTPGTLICAEEDIMKSPIESQVVTGIAYSKDDTQITLRHVADKPGVAAGVFGPLAEANINVDMIIQNISEDGATTDITFTVPSAEHDRALKILEDRRDAIGYKALQGAKNVAKVSAIGVGMRSHSGVAAKAFRALSEKGINILAITTSEIKFSVLIDAAYSELAVRTLHSLYGLDEA
jgi:aspartate kinase